MSGRYCQLNMEERRQVYRYLEAGRTKTEIAGLLDRHRSTIFREVRRNSIYDIDHSHNGYFHVNAQELARERRAKLRKLERFPALKSFVVERLEDCWSRDQISGYLWRCGVGPRVSHETIYGYVSANVANEIQIAE